MPDAVPPFFDEAGVSVSTTRIVVYGTAFPLKETTGVRFFTDRPHIRFAVPILVIGVLLLIYGGFVRSSPMMAVGVMLGAVSYLTYKFQTMRHRIFALRPTGETEVLVSSDLAFAHRVEAALKQALAGSPGVSSVA